MATTIAATIAAAIAATTTQALEQELCTYLYKGHSHNAIPDRISLCRMVMSFISQNECQCRRGGGELVLHRYSRIC